MRKVPRREPRTPIERRIATVETIEPLRTGKYGEINRLLFQNQFFDVKDNTYLKWVSRYESDLAKSPICHCTNQYLIFPAGYFQKNNRFLTHQVSQIHNCLT